MNIIEKIFGKKKQSKQARQAYDFTVAFCVFVFMWGLVQSFTGGSFVNFGIMLLALAVVVAFFRYFNGKLQ